MLHALAGVHDVATLTVSPWDRSGANAFYGTSIPEGRVRSLVVPAPLRWLARLPEQRMSRIRMCAVLRYAGPSRANTIADHGRQLRRIRKAGIQYLHFPADLHLRPTARADRESVFCPVQSDRRYSVEAAQQNVSIVNSQWTADRVGVPVAHVLYPPVVDPGPGLPWEQRTDTFLHRALSRIEANRDGDDHRAAPAGRRPAGCAPWHCRIAGRSRLQSGGCFALPPDRIDRVPPGSVPRRPQ